MPPIDWDAVKPEVEKAKDAIFDLLKVGVGELADDVKDAAERFLKDNALKIARYNYALRYGDEREQSKAETILAAMQSQLSSTVAIEVEDAADSLKQILKAVVGVVIETVRVVLPKLL